MNSSADVLLGKVLIVDDQEANVALLERMLYRASYEHVSSTTDSTEVCALHEANKYDLIILDLQMPVMDGFEVMEALGQIEPDGYLPVLVITAQPDYKLRALEAGARDFISKPFDQAEVLARVCNMLEVRLLHRELRSYNEQLETRVKERTAEVRESHLETIFTLTRAAEHRDEDIGSHVQRISYYCRELAQMLGLGGDFVEEIFFASPMHDVGKIGVSDAVLLKPGPLTPEDWVAMKTHPAIGSRILGDSRFRYLRMGAEIALNHHERWCGGGYPNGTCGEAIPLAARILSICDTYDALRSVRPYKPALDHAQVIDIVTHGDGRTEPEHFDPDVLAVFAKNHLVLRDVFATFSEQRLMCDEPGQGVHGPREGYCSARGG